MSPLLFPPALLCLSQTCNDVGGKSFNVDKNFLNITSLEPDTAVIPDANVNVTYQIKETDLGFVVNNVRHSPPAPRPQSGYL